MVYEGGVTHFMNFSIKLLLFPKNCKCRTSPGMKLNGSSPRFLAGPSLVLLKVTCNPNLKLPLGRAVQELD